MVGGGWSVSEENVGVSFVFRKGIDLVEVEILWFG